MDKKDFLKSEIRNGFSVSAKRKKIWQIQIKLLSILNDLCKKHNLKYFASNGTLLGCVRHGGFVPWDDDSDIVMFRKDYDKLIEICKNELPDNIVLYKPESDGLYYKNYLRLIDNDTTALSPNGWGRNYPSGIFVDIFVLDECPPIWLVWQFQKALICLSRVLITSLIYYEDSPKNNIINKIGWFCLNKVSKFICKVIGYQFLLNFADFVKKLWPSKKTNKVFLITHGKTIMVFEKKLFSKTIYKDFEYIKLPVSAYYDELLKMHYGDYMTFPPESERGIHHSIFFDPDKSWKQYVGKLSKEEAKHNLNNY